MKKFNLIQLFGLCLLVLNALSISNIFAQAPNWLWAKSNSPYITSVDITTDNIGNIYVTGNFYNSISFDNFTLTTSGGRDIFIVKYDPSGNFIWARKAGGSDDDSGNAIAVDGAGNVYVTGNFKSLYLNIDTSSINNTNMSDCNNDVFIAKFVPAGNLIWVNRPRSNGDASGKGIVLDSGGNSYVTGFTSSDSYFDSMLMLSNGYFDGFIAKLSPNGVVLWAKLIGGLGNDYGESITLDSFGNPTLVGNYGSNSLDFGGGTLTSNPIGGDFFIVKYNPAGNFLWARTAGGSDNDIVSECCADEYGGCVVTGTYESPQIIFGSDTLNNFGNSANPKDIFVVKYDQSGNIVWAEKAGGIYNDEPLGICSGQFGVQYLTGYFQSPTAVFGNDSLSCNNSIGNYPDIFVAKFASNGDVIWARANGGTGSDFSDDIALTPQGTVLVTGHFWSLNFQLGGNTLQGNGNSGLQFGYVAKLDQITGQPEQFISNFSVKPNPVENIFWEGDPNIGGIYKIYVNQFNKRESSDTGFEVEVEYDGQTYNFSKAQNGQTGVNHPICEFSYTRKDGFKMITDSSGSGVSKYNSQTNN